MTNSLKRPDKEARVHQVLQPSINQLLHGKRRPQILIIIILKEFRSKEIKLKTKKKKLI